VVKREARERREIRVLGIEFTGYHGVFEEERKNGRRFRVDVIAEVEGLKGFTSDDLDDTIDYRTFAQAVVDVGTGESVKLVEHLVHLMAEGCLAIPGVRVIDITCNKRATGVPGDPEWVGVRVVRKRADDG
jgi:dihydroneopterin aldolase